MGLYHRRIDANQNQIVDAFRKKGASVLILSMVGKGCPDLLIAKNGHTVLVEVKDGSKPMSAQKLTEDERCFHETWKGELVIIRDKAGVNNLISSLDERCS